MELAIALVVSSLIFAVVAWFVVSSTTKMVTMCNKTVVETSGQFRALGQTVTDSLNRHTSSNMNLLTGIEMAASYFSPMKRKPCKTCGGEGYVEVEAPLLTALAEAVQAQNRRR